MRLTLERSRPQPQPGPPTLSWRREPLSRTAVVSQEVLGGGAQPGLEGDCWNWGQQRKTWSLTWSMVGHHPRGARAVERGGSGSPRLRCSWWRRSMVSRGPKETLGFAIVPRGQQGADVPDCSPVLHLFPSAYNTAAPPPASPPLSWQEAREGLGAGQKVAAETVPL